MTAQALQILCIGLGLALLLSIPQFPGAMIGFFSAIAIAFFVVPASVILAALLAKIGLRVQQKQIVLTLGAIWLLIAGYRAYLASIGWGLGDGQAARLLAGQAIFMFALPLICLVSMKSMARAWP